MRGPENLSKNQLTTVVSCAVIAILMVGGIAGAQTDQAVGPDVVTFDVYAPYRWGTDGGIVAYSVGTESCNRGDEPLGWYSSNNLHPVIAQALYRYKDGRLEQLGMSWLKHGFLSLNTDACDDCVYPPDGGSQLGIGCADPYWASLNGSQDRLGPRYEVNAFTGENVYPHGSPTTGAALLRGRLLVVETEMDQHLHPGARYFTEGQYVAADEAAAGNSENSASYREVFVEWDSGPGWPGAEEDGWNLVDTGSTFEGLPAIYAWQQVDPTVDIREARVPAEGLFIVASSVSDNGNGTWRYEYGVFNVNSHRSAGSFTVPIRTDAQITNPGFYDVDYHSGEPYDPTDWSVTVDNAGGTVTWASSPPPPLPFDPLNANALRWGTMYNFWFDADKPPHQDMAVIGLFLEGTPAAIDTVVSAPAIGSLIFSDGFETGDTQYWD